MITITSPSKRAPVNCPKFMETIDELHGMLVRLLEDPTLSDQKEAARISEKIEEQKRIISARTNRANVERELSAATSGSRSRREPVIPEEEDEEQGSDEHYHADRRRSAPPRGKPGAGDTSLLSAEQEYAQDPLA